ncbi:hypothetical protein Tco_0214962 [Tanacetum coccineum]
MSPQPKALKILTSQACIPEWLKLCMDFIKHLVPGYARLSCFSVTTQILKCQEIFQVSKKATKNSACGTLKISTFQLEKPTGHARSRLLWLLLLQKPSMLLLLAAVHRLLLVSVPIIFGPQPRPDNYLEPEDLDNIISMEDDTTHGGFHEESPVGPDDAPTPTADAAGRAEDPAILTSLSAKLDRCMGRIDSLETELGKSKKIMGGAILTLVSRVKKLEKTVKKMRDTRLVVDASTEEGDVDIQDDIDLDGLSRMASAALGQPAVPSDDVEERDEEEVPLRRKRSAYRRARTELTTPAFEQFRANISADVLPHIAVPEPTGISVATDKGKAPLPELDIPAEFAEDLAQEDLPNVSAERTKELDDLMMRMTETDWLNLMMQVGSNPALARELLGADVTEENFIERMTAVKERKKRALADLRYRALKGKPLKKSEVTQLMRNLVKNQWCAAHNGTITMKEVKAMNQKQLVEEYEYICRRLEKDRLLSAQYNLFRPKPAITEPPSKRQRVERTSSQLASVPATTTHTADDPDSAGGGSSNPAGSATPMAGSAASNTAGGTFDATGIDSTVTTTAAMDSAGSRREIGVSPFADSAASSSPSNVSIDHIPIDVLFESTSGGILEFFLESDEEERIGMSRVVADPDSDDEVFAEIIFRGKSISADGVVFVDKLPDDEIVDPRVKVETVSESASSPPRSRRKHLGVRSDDFLWDKPVEDFFSSESESDDDMENYIPPLPYGAFKDWEIVSCPLSNSYYHVYYQENRRRRYFTYLKQLLPHVYREDLLLLRRRMNRYFRLNPDVDVGLELWRDVNLLCQSLHSDDVEDFWRTQDEWIVCSWKLYPKSSVHVLDLTNGKTVYMFVDKFYPIRATLLERMLRHRLTVPPSYCRDVVVAGNIIQTVQDGLRQAYECIASAPIACTARQMVFSSPWLTAKKESGSPLQTALVCYQKLDGIHFPCSCWDEKWLVQEGTALELASPEQTATGKDMSNPLYGCDGLPKTVRVFQFTLDSRSEKLDWFLLHQDWKLLFFDVATSFDSAVHRVHAVSFDAAVLDVASTVSAACIVAAGYIVSAGICDAAGSFVLAVFIYICCRELLLQIIRYRALKGKPLKQSEVTKMMRNLVKNQWCAAHNGTITMKAVTAMSKQHLLKDTRISVRRLEKDRFIDPRCSCCTPKHTLPDDPDSAGGRSFHPAGSTPMSGSAVPETAGGPLDTTDSDIEDFKRCSLDSDEDTDRYFRLNPDVDVGLDLWRDVNLLCQSLIPDMGKIFWRTQDEMGCQWLEFHAIRAPTAGKDVTHTKAHSSTLIQSDVVVAGIWKSLLRDVAASFDSAVHRDHAGSFDAVVPSLVSAACCTAGFLNSIPADYVSAGLVLVPADSDRIC